MIASAQARPTFGQVRRLARLTTCCFIAFDAWYVVAHSDFDNEDIQNFVLLRTSGFWQFLLMSTNVHFVPGRRLPTWVSYSIAPLFVSDSRLDVDAPVRYRVREDGYVDQHEWEKTSTDNS